MTETTRRILALQKAKGVNDHQLEKGANLPISSIQVWTKGKKRKNGSITETSPSVDSIVNLARYFNVSTDYLLCLTDEPTANQSHLTAEEQDLLSVFAEYSHDDQIRIIEQLRCQVKLTKGVDVFGLFSSKETTVATATTSKK